MENLHRGKIFAAGIVLIMAVVGFFTLGNLAENVDADEIVVIQSPVSGELTWYKTPGMKWQGFGKVTRYRKRSIYEFVSQIRFNDGAHATMKGSIQYELPLTDKNLADIHTKFGSQEAVQKQLVQTVVDKSIYMSGPLMSSKESYAEKRNALINYVEDQVARGVYKTTQRDDRQKDPITGAEKTVTIVEIVHGKDDALPLRQEEAVLASFQVKPFNFAITALDYDDAVEKQIGEQQKATMGVQTAMAEARKAEQAAITAEKDGMAKAAKAKWEQEVLKAKAVTEAQQKLEVAELDAKAAEQEKRASILRGEGEGERKRLVMAADGALTQKLDAYIKVSQMYATAMATYKGQWVPSVVMGQNGQSGNGAQTMIDMLTAKAASDLSVDLSASGNTRR